MSLRKSIHTKDDTLHTSDSVLNLTKPELFGFFNNNDSSLNLNEQDLLLIEQKKKDNLVKKNQKDKQSIQFSVVTKLIVVSLAIAAYSNVLPYIVIHDTTINKQLQFSNKLVMDFFKVNYAALFVLGLVLASVVPALDYLYPAGSYRLLSSNPNRLSTNKFIVNELVRSSLTFLGINYAIRNLNWNSFLQVSMVWSMLNPGLWLLLDGTVNGFAGSVIVSTIGCTAVWFKNSFLFLGMIWDGEFLALWLWIGSFLFCGGIVFGKIGRNLK